MLESLSKHVAGLLAGKYGVGQRDFEQHRLEKHDVEKDGLVLPGVPAQLLLSAGTLGSFAWLLLQNRIHPIVVYVLQVYLTF